MENSRVIHSTFVLERKFKAPPERVFAAFADPETKRRWFFTSTHHELQSHELDFKVNGKERAQMKFADGPIAGKTLVNEIAYEDIRANQRIVAAYRMSLDGQPFSAALATIEMFADGSGTELVLTHQGAYFEGADGPEMRKGGWEHLLGKLGQELGE